MSTGLMSCVRENSPPLEMSGSESGALSLPSSGAEPQQKRRRFHPLRNLRRIFRRRTMTSVDSPAISPVSSPSSPSSSQLSSAPTVIASVPAHSLSTYCKSSTPGDVTATMSSTAYPPHLIGLSGARGGGNCAGVAIVSPFSSSASASSGFYIKDIREHSDNVFKLKESSANDLDDNREMTDCQRSFSEGRLVDSDFSRDGLSQSHDSVFSESATASSLSILKAELFDVLRKRRNRPDASDEDLGLPRSPTTPQRKDQTIKSNQSEVSSLSLLSMASSDLDDDYGIGERTTSSVSSKISPDTSRNSDEIDFVISIGSRLSHSAARHKMAVRPKKKGPTRHRRPIESTILPSTPEVNEEILKVTLDVKDITEKGKSHSLPPGVNAKILEQHSHDNNITKEVTNSHIKRSKTEKVTSPTGAYSVRNISASSSSSSTAATTTTASTSTIEAELHSSSSINSMFDRKDDEGGFFRRLLLRNSKKNKKNTDESDTIKSDDSQATSTTTISGIESSSSYKTYEKTESEFIHSSSKVEETRKEIRKEILSEAKSSLSAMLNTFILSPDHETEPEPQPPPALVHQQQQQNIPKVHKPKSGPAARQRFIPKDLTNSPLPDIKIADMSTTTTASTATSQFIAEEKDNSNKTSVILQYPPIKAKPEVIEVPKIMSFKSDLVTGPQGDNQSVVNKLDKSENNADLLMTGSRMAKSLTEESFRSSTASVKETITTTTSATVEHYEKRERIQPKIVGLSPFMQKMTRSEPFTLDSTHPVPKQRKSVEKSKSFRYYSENTNKDDIENGLKKHENMPSLPDLSYPRKISTEIAGCNKQYQQQQLQQQQQQLPLAFEINDNNLIKLHRDEEPLPLSQGIYTKNIILTTTQKPLAPLFTSSSTTINVPKPLASPTCNQNITEIEENIDKLLIKSPFVTVLKKSSLLDENNCENNTKISNNSNNSSSSSSNIINSTSNNINNIGNKNATKISVTSIRRIDDFDNNNKIVEQFQATSTTIAAGGNTKLIEKDTERTTDKISSTTTVEKLVSDEKSSTKHFGLEKSTSLEMLISDEKSSSAKLIISGGDGGGNRNEKKQSTTTTTTTEQKVLNEISSSIIDNAINKVELRKDNCNKSVSTTNKARRNSSVLEKFDNCSSNHVPEFMKIQLNRVESTRPKSNIVLSKNVKDNDDIKHESTRRYSNESVELTDTKPPIPPPAVVTEQPLSTKRSSGTPAGTELPVSTKRSSATTTSTPTATTITSTTITANQSKSLSDDELKSPKAVKKVNEDNTILRNTENTLQQQQQQQTIQTHQTIVFERRKSVTEEKLKYEKKVEELKLEKKKPTVQPTTVLPSPPPPAAPPAGDDNNTRLIDSRKMSIDDETGVVLRKKSFALINQSINNNNKDDSTPELMKVFARRSLKIKDEDIPNIEDLDKTTTTTTTTTTNTLKKFTNLDSDKENQSSSEEKLDKLPKVEITIQTANKQNVHQKSDDIKTRNSLTEFRKPNTNITTTTTTIQSTAATPTKSFIQPMRYSSNIVGYRSVSTVFNNKTSTTTQSTALTAATTNNQEQSSTTGTTTTVIQQQSNNNNTEQINNNNNNNNNNSNNNNNHYTSSTNSNVNNKKLVGIRHTIGPSTPTNNSTTTPTTGIIDSKREDSNEFKGILQRRAEWEKRAKEALK